MKTQRKLTLLLYSFFILVFSVMKSPAQVQKMEDKPIAKGLKVGDKAPDFKLVNIDNKVIRLADFNEAKGFIVIFTCNHCPFSVAYQDRIMALNEQFIGRGYPVIAINSNDKDVSPDDSFDHMVIRAAEKKFQFPYLYDDSQDIAKLYGASRTPHVYVLQKKDADLIVKYIGAIDDNSDEPALAKQHYVQDAVNALLEGKEVKVSSTKAIGCTIKWKKA